MFSTPLDLRADGPGHWILLQDLIWDDGTERFVVPAGFKTDLASIPRAFRWLLQQNGKSRKAAVLHDYLYRVHPSGISRKQADDLFRRALEAERMLRIGRFLYWAGVRLGGWLPFRQHR